MKKIIIFTIVLFVEISGIAQNKNTCGEVYYTQVKDLEKVNIQNYLMKFNYEESCYKETNIKFSRDNSKIEDKESEQGSTSRTYSSTVGRSDITPKFFYKFKNDFYFRDNFGNKILIVKEDFFLWNWKLHKETKQVGGFTCQKATIRFRGRDYIAWFTKEIPVTFGPWKFQGLPGLILEVYDVDEIFHITANKIKINKKADCTISIDKNQFKKALTISEYRNRKEDIIKAIFKKMSSRMPKEVKGDFKYDKNCKDCPKELEIFDEEK